jgi:hypothetical protein
MSHSSSSLTSSSSTSGYDNIESSSSCSSSSSSNTKRDGISTVSQSMTMEEFYAKYPDTVVVDNTAKKKKGSAHDSSIHFQEWHTRSAGMSIIRCNLCGYTCMSAFLVLLTYHFLPTCDGHRMVSRCYVI